MTRKWIVAFALPIAAAALVVVPLVIDQPFAAQTPRTMLLAYWMRRVSPTVTPILAIALLAVAVQLGRSSRWWGKGVLAALVIVTTGAAWFAWQNPFEWMFAPLAKPRFVAVSDAGFVAPGDLVIAVSLDGEAAAYPIRQLAYHHLVNDRIGRTPAVVTY